MEQNKTTGYPSIDKPWLKYYGEEAINVPLPECTMYEYLYACNQQHLNGTALRFYGKEITYLKLFENIEVSAQALWSMGIRRGDIVPMLVTNCPETIYIIYALNKIGAIPDMEYPALSVEALDAAIQQAGAHTVVMLDILLRKYINVVQKNKNTCFVIVSASDSLPVIGKALNKIKSYKSIRYASNNVVSFHETLKRTDSIEYKPVAYQKDEAAIILHSGGTTGTPKGVVLTNENQNAIAIQFKYSDVGFTKDESFMHGIPSFHAFGFAVGIHMPLCYGLCVYLIARFDEGSIKKSFFKYRPHHFIAGTLHAKQIINSINNMKTDLSWLAL